jgi:release factor glutamine methyltransferase
MNREEAPLRTVGSLLAAARHAGVDRLDAHVLLGHVLGRPRAWLIAHEDAPVDLVPAATMASLLQQRARGVPVAYLVGEREFHGLMLKVRPDVLVPRPETELLVDWALELIAPDACAEVLDLGTGSGAIALALRHHRPRLQVTAVDIDPAALTVARENAQRLGLPVTFVPGRWFGALAGRRFDLIVSNPPYVDGGDPHLQALTAEPLHALTPGPDGLAALREIVQAAPAHLQPGGWLLLEHGHSQGEAVQALLAGHGFRNIGTRTDLAGLPRCTGGRLPAADSA